MPTFTPLQLESVGRAVLEGLGTPPDLAQLVSHSLVESNLVGHDSHGMMRLMQYANFVRAGQVIPDARCALLKQTQGAAVVDGAFGWGQPAAQFAVSTATALADQYGVSAITISHCNHIGRLGEYVETIARAGCIGIAMANVDPSVAPFGGRTRMLGTDPMAFAVPQGAGHDPVMVDLATSGVAEGKLRVARDKGETVPPGLIIDKEGNPSTDPNAFYNGGALLPFGGHKGFGLAVMCELMGGALSGMAPSCLPEYAGGNGTLLIALKIAAFVPLAQFTDQADRFARAIQSAPPAPGTTSVLMPGTPEWQMRRNRLERGIELPERTWNDIRKLAEQLNVAL